jgi:exosortase/archaeosortase
MWVLYRQLRDHRLTGRVLLVPVFVAGCYLHDWAWLRALTTITLVRISALLDIPMHRTGADMVTVAGLVAQFTVACTMIDAFFGAIPLLWRTTAVWSRNLMRLGVVLGAVFVLNIVRQEVGFIAISRGAPWWLAHECVAGVAYFCLYVFVMRERAWDRPRPAGLSSTRSINSQTAGAPPLAGFTNSGDVL